MREGQLCDKVILIRSGEFKVLKDSGSLISPAIEMRER